MCTRLERLKHKMHGAKTLFLLFINAMLIPGGSFVLHRGLMALSEADKSAIGFQNLLSAGQENNKSPAESLSVLHDLLQALLSSSFPTAVADGISEQCKADSIQYVHSIFSNHSIWALQSKYCCYISLVHGYHVTMVFLRFS